MEQSEGERRRYVRAPTNLDAVAATPDGPICDCSILDINIYGARIEAEQDTPDELFLVDMASNVAYRARVAWRKAPLFGVRFIETWLLSGEGAPQWLRDVRAERLAAITPEPAGRPQRRDTLLMGVRQDLSRL